MTAAWAPCGRSWVGRGPRRQEAPRPLHSSPSSSAPARRYEMRKSHAVVATIALVLFATGAYLGTRNAHAQSSLTLAAFDFGSVGGTGGIIAADASGTIWQHWSGGTRVVGRVPGHPVQLTVNGWTVFVGLDNGDVYSADGYQTDQSNFT